MARANARLTVDGRRLIIERARAGWKHAHVAAVMGIFRTCVKRWLMRYRTEGEAGLVDRFSRPHTSPTPRAPRSRTQCSTCVRRSASGGMRSLSGSAFPLGRSRASCPVTTSRRCARWTDHRGGGPRIEDHRGPL